MTVDRKAPPVSIDPRRLGVKALTEFAPALFHVNRWWRPDHRRCESVTRPMKHGQRVFCGLGQLHRHRPPQMRVLGPDAAFSHYLSIVSSIPSRPNPYSPAEQLLAMWAAHRVPQVQE